MMSYKKTAQVLSMATVLLLGTIAQAQQTTFGEVFVVQASDRQPTVTIGGTVVPYKEVTLAAQSPGRVKYLAGREGDSFSKDAMLVAIDETELLAKRASAYAQLSSAQAQLRNV